MSFDVNHSFFFLNVGHNVHNFKNILVTLAKKHQLTMAYYLVGPRLFTSPLQVQNLRVVKTSTLVATVKNELQRTYSHREIVSLASSVQFQGTHYKEGMVLSSEECSDLPEFHRIRHILVDPSKVCFLCQNLSSWYIEHYSYYEIIETTTFTMLEPGDLNYY